jgi:hypothetical protein
MRYHDAHMRSGLPTAADYAPFFGRYVTLVNSEDIVGHLAEQLPLTIALLRSLEPERRYSPGKWSVKQVLGHMIDTERVMAYRALRISRGDTTPLPGFDQDVLVNGARFDEQPMEELIEEFECVRKSTVMQLRGVTGEMWDRVGTASDHPISARALAYIIGGHELYHVGLLEKLYQPIPD